MDINSIRKDFGILSTKVHNKPLIYFDSAASTQKPKQVLDAMQTFDTNKYANVHRGSHHLTALATQEFEAARDKIKAFINAPSQEQCIFVRGTTEAINLVAHGFARSILKAGDEIIISCLEHHSNIVPWQIVCQQTGAKLKIIDSNSTTELDLKHFKSLISDKTKLLAIQHISNAFGTIHPLKKFITIAKAHKVPVLIDGAQAAAHEHIDVQSLDCDFYAFSAHKMYGPTGIGVLYAKQHWLEQFPPYQAGGEMIAKVSFDKTTYNKLPYKFEAGTPAISQAIGFGAAIDYINAIGLDNIKQYEHKLLKYAHEKLATIDGLKIIGTASKKAAIVSFLLNDIHPHDIGTMLDNEGIEIRTGRHCVEPGLNYFGLNSTARASFAIYNTIDEIDKLTVALQSTAKTFKK